MHDPLIDLDKNRLLWIQSSGEGADGISVGIFLLKKYADDEYSFIIRFIWPDGQKTAYELTPKKGTIEFKNDKAAIEYAKEKGNELCAEMIKDGVKFKISKEYTFPNYKSNEELVKYIGKSGLFQIVSVDDISSPPTNVQD